MSKLKQIIRLHCQGKGSKAVSAATGVSRRTVEEYITKFLSHHLTAEEAASLNDLKLHQLFFPPVKTLKVPDEARPDHSIEKK